MHLSQAVLLTLILAGTGIHMAQAAGTPSPDDTSCITLADEHKAKKIGPETLLVSDGQNHLRLDFGSYCNAISHSSSVRISTNGQSNVVCAKGTTVNSKRDSCSVHSISRISAEEFKRFARLRH